MASELDLDPHHRPTTDPTPEGAATWAPAGSEQATTEDAEPTAETSRRLSRL